MSRRRPVLVGNGQGFWGDSAVGPVQLVDGGPLHYLTLDYLAEVTMSVLQKARARDPAFGYAPDFVTTVGRILPRCRERGIRIVANAGGVNPRACADAVAVVAKKVGATGTRIGVVEGDDILDRLPDLLAAGECFTNLDTGEPLGPYVGEVQSANVYLGAAPLVHEHGWKLAGARRPSVRARDRDGGGGAVRRPLRDVAMARSGDKGAHANVGVWVHDAAVYDALRSELSAARVAAHFAAMRPEGVERYELPNLLAFNFVLFGVLGQGGAAASLRTDAQAKTYASGMLMIEVDVDLDVNPVSKHV
jgi:hypothetical protein